MLTIDPRPRACHRAGGRARAVERPVEVDREHRPPLVVGEAHERVEGRRDGARIAASASCRSTCVVDPRSLRYRRDAGVVDPDVDRSERVTPPPRGHDRPRRCPLTSAWTATPPASSAVSFAASRFTSSTATRAPSCASRTQIASPRPEPPPVTTATLPSSHHGTTTARPTTSPSRSRRYASTASSSRSCSTSTLERAGLCECDDLVELPQRAPARLAQE